MERRKVQGTWQSPIVRRVCIDQDRGIATFLNATRPIALAGCWNDVTAPKLWLYHLHYFEDLGGQFRNDGHDMTLAWVRRWIDQNEPTKGNGWEPYPASRRVVNWIKTSLDGLPLDKDVLRSLARQVAHIESRLEYHLLANHLFVNAKALVYAGTFFRGNDADRCLMRGIDLVLRQLDEQVLDDGGHFERSAMYHASFLEDVLDLLNICRAYRGVQELVRLESALLDRAVPLLDWLVRMVCPDGSYPRFNDSTGGEVPSLEELLAYGARLGLAPTVSRHLAAEHLSSSGFARASAGGWTVLADIGGVAPSYQPGHAHAGTLSLEVYDGDRCIVCGSGVSTYEIGEEREFERSTAARWAVSVDGQNSSEVWAGFRVGRRAKVYDAHVGMESGSCTIEAWHDGFDHLHGHPRVGRHVEISKKGVNVTDSVHGAGSHTLSAGITLHPSISSDVLGPGHAILRHAEGMSYELVADPPVTFQRRAGWFAPEFGVRRTREVLFWEVVGVLPETVRFRLTRL